MNLKLIFIFIGLVFAGGALVFTLAKENDNRWGHWFGGVCSILALFYFSATPMPNGQTFHIENGRPVRVS